jgi:hypothetical protein
MSISFLLLPLSLGAVDVTSQAACPSAAQVHAALKDMAVPGRDSGHRFVRIAPSRAGVEVDMRDEQGRVLAARTLPGAESCEALSQGIAVLVSAWLASLPPEPPPALQLAGPAPPPAPNAPRVTEWAVGAGGAWTGSTGSAFAGALELDGSWGALRGVGGVAQAVGSSAWAEPFEGGQVSWNRFALGAGPRYRLGAGPGVLDVSACVLAGLLWVRGEGYLANSAEVGADVGVGLGARWTFGSWAWAPWVGLEGRQWFRRQEVTVTGASGQWTVPSLELALTLGIRWASL